MNISEVIRAIKIDPRKIAELRDTGKVTVDGQKFRRVGVMPLFTGERKISKFELVEDEEMKSAEEIIVETFEVERGQREMTRPSESTWEHAYRQEKARREMAEGALNGLRKSSLAAVKEKESLGRTVASLTESLAAAKGRNLVKPEPEDDLIVRLNHQHEQQMEVIRMKRDIAIAKRPVHWYFAGLASASLIIGAISAALIIAGG